MYKLAQETAMAKINAERLELARKSFEDRGESIVEWARRNRFHPDAVYAILGGRNKGTRGEGHHIAIALGIKPAPPKDLASEQY